MELSLPISIAGEAFTAIGTHGTTVTRLESIQREGFSCSQFARRGRGVYFWQATDENCDYAMQLAMNWHKSSMSRNAYAGDLNKDPVVIYAEITEHEGAIIDTEDLVFRNNVRRIFNEKFCDRKPTESEASAIYEFLYSNVCSLLGIEDVSIVVGILPGPKISDRFKGYLGDPTVIVVRNLDCVNILKVIKEFQNEKDSRNIK